MPQKNILLMAQRQALKIHLDIALMAKPTTIWQKVDNLLQTLTGYPEFYEDDIDSKPTPVPAPAPAPPPTPPPTALILSLLEKHSGGLTPYRICKETSLETETAQQAYQRTYQKAVNLCPEKKRQENLRSYEIIGILSANLSF